MPRPWRDTHGSLSTLTAKVNALQYLSIIRAKKINLWIIYLPLFTGNAEIVSWILWVTFILSGVNVDLVLSFSDLPAWECFPAPAVSSGEFHHPHTCTVHRISWSFLPHTGQMMSLRGLHMTVINVLEFVFAAFVVVSVIVDFHLCLLMWGNIYSPWLMFIKDLYTFLIKDSVKELVVGEQAEVIREHKHWQDWELVKVIWTCSYDFICAFYNSKSVLQMACQEKDTESLKSLQTELWWAFRNINFHHVMGLSSIF